MDKKRKRNFYNAVLLVLAVTAVASGGMIVSRLAAMRRNNAAFEALAGSLDGRSKAALMRPGDAGETGKAGEAGNAAGGRASDRMKGASAGAELRPEEALALRKERLAQYEDLAGQNPDLAGWVSIPGTKVDYPVMQTADRPDYYLKHNFEKKRSAYGVPYAAEDCSLSGGCHNVIVYGHHMKDGSMFAALSDYTDRDFYEEHPWFWFDTRSEAGLYRIIGICKASAAGGGGDRLFGMARIGNEEEYEAYVEEIKRRSFYDTGVTAVWGEPLVTLMTCEYTAREGRLLLVGKRYTEH